MSFKTYILLVGNVDCAIGSVEIFSRVYRLILLEAWLLNWLLTVPSTVFVIQLHKWAVFSNGLAVRITFLMLLSACKDSDFHISTA